MSWTNRIARVVLTGVHKLMKLGWFVRRPSTLGAHALALTADRKVVLVRLRYAPGWRVPGGGRSRTEDPQAAVLRELREEIGLISHGAVRFLGENAERVDHKRDVSTLHVVEDVIYVPRRFSLEIEQVCEFALDAIPADTHATTRRWIEQLRLDL